MKEIDQFIGQIKKVGNSLCVIIPHTMVKFSGLNEGDTIKVYYRKMGGK